MTFGILEVSKLIQSDDKKHINSDPKKEELHDYIESQKDYYDLSPLVPDKKKISEMNFKSIAEFDEVKMQATKNNLKIMNVIRYSAPILKIVCDREKTDENRSKLFTDINDRLSDYSKKIMKIWNISTEDPSNNWMINVLTRTLASGLSEDMLLSEHDIEKLALSVYNVSELTQETKSSITFFNGLTASVKISIIKTIVPIYNVLEQYSFLKDQETKDREIESIIKFLVNKSAESVAVLSEDIADEKDRTMLFKVVLEESAKIFTHEWIKYGILFEEKYKNKNKDEMDIVIKNNPKGFEVLGFICKKFEERYNHLINISKI